MSKSAKAKTETKRDGRHFISLFVSDKTLKGRIAMVADLEGRTMAGFLVYHALEQVIEPMLAARYAKMTPAQKKMYEALEKAD